MKCKIKCPVHTKNNREWEITPDGRVWPCCYYANGWDGRASPSTNDHKLFDSDTVMQQLLKEDPTWNDLNTHPLSDIVEHDIYKEYLYFPGWESNNPSPLCVEECSVFIDEVTGQQSTNSNLYADLRDEE